MISSLKNLNHNQEKATQIPEDLTNTLSDFKIVEETKIEPPK